MKLAAILFLLSPSLIFATLTIPSPGFSPENQLLHTPWFTGSLLAPTAINMQPGHPAIEPSVTVFKTYGEYNSNWKTKKQDTIWAINPFVDFQFGITNKIGIETLISFICNFKNGKTASNFQDTIVLFGYQVSNDIKGSWVPDFRLIIQETFPTGKYQKLNPKKQGIDSTGYGSYQTGPIFVFRKLFSLYKNFLSLRWSIGYLFPSTVYVKNFNTYGGGYGTKGKVTPGQTVIAFFSGEYSISQRWVLSFDTEFFYQKRSIFNGKRGLTTTGNVASTGLPNSVQISFAPEIEYNFTSTSGLLSGVWFTVAGKNSAAFASAFIAYLYIF